MEKDEMAAMEWYSKAAEQGHGVAQFAMGQLWLKGYMDKNIGRVVRDDDKALECFRAAAEQGHLQAITAFKSLAATLHCVQPE